MCGCCGSNSEKEKKTTYKCGTCGRTSDKQDRCCGDTMKEKK